ncbi:MAG TPA: protein-export chaperone SecB [Dongiaceae bacterium]|jgi:preprotein translocase subunit SecB|nr:protein-export chaperone SecB [Dongiaceae bacterium]
MAEQTPTPPNGGDNAQANAGTQAGAPLTIVHQYLKDFSFENPNSAEGFKPLTEMPTGFIRVDVRVKPMTPPDIEVSLFLAAEAKIGDTSVYVVESEYAGIFRLGRVPQEHMLPLIMIEAPRLLFPFSRQLIAAAVQAGGFPPLFINPVDFVALYRERQPDLQEAIKEAQAQESKAKA